MLILGKKSAERSVSCDGYCAINTFYAKYLHESLKKIVSRKKFLYIPLHFRKLARKAMK